MAKVKCRITFRFKREIEKYNLFHKGQRVMLGFSGGPDSVFLFHMLSKIEEEYNLDLSIVYINHMLRGEESIEEELFVKSFAEKYNINLIVERVDVKGYSKENKKGIEESARNLRYSVFDKLQCDAFALAHNMDDKVETFLFRLFRGSSLGGLASISMVRGKYIRPILNFRKKEILDFLNENSISFFSDSSNLTNKYTRNRIRNSIIPLIEQINPSFRESILSIMGQITSSPRLQSEEYSVENLLEMDDLSFGKYISDLFNEKNLELNRRKLSQIREVLKGRGTKSLDVGKGYILRKRYDELSLEKVAERPRLDSVELLVDESIVFGKYRIKVEEINIVKELKLKKGEHIFLADGDKLRSEKFIVRSRVEGDSFQPVGFEGHKSLKKYLMERKIPKDTRDQIPIISCEGDIVWVVGLRGSEKFKANKESKKVLKFSFSWIQ